MPGHTSKEQTTPRRRCCNACIVAIVLLATMAGVAVRSPYALLTVVLDGAAAAIIIVPPMLAGLWLVPLVTKDKLPWRWHVLLGFAFGLGVTSTLVLALGVVGRLDRSLWVFVLGAMAVAGVVRVAILVRRAQAQRAAARESEAHGHESWRWLWLLVPPFLSLALLAAARVEVRDSK